MNICPIFLAGGSGTRLWPLSRQLHPKQFLALTSSLTMFQETCLRLRDFNNHDTRVVQPIIVCNREHRFLVEEQLSGISEDALRIIEEPMGRNTAPALSLASHFVTASLSKDTILLVMPVDHSIKDVTAFQGAVNTGIPLAAKGYLVTFGIVPNSPETGYGYIEKGDPLSESATKIKEFVEKPDLDTATKFLDTGNYLWNSGIFMMKASTWQSALVKYQPSISNSCHIAISNGQDDGRLIQPDLEAFSQCPVDSIDYAVMEPVSRDTATPDLPGAAVIPLNAKWSDMGSWKSIWDESPKDASGNAIFGQVHTESTYNSLIMSENRLIVTADLEDIVIIETGDALLVSRKDSSANIKKVVEALVKENKPEVLDSEKVHRPWGYYRVIDKGPDFAVKRLTVSPHSALSLQFHNHRSEHWTVVAGVATVTINDKTFKLDKNESVSIPKGGLHRLSNESNDILELVEIQTGDYLGEDDIVRLEDRYNRI